MAWYSYTLACAAKPIDGASITDAQSIAEACAQDSPMVSTASRNGTLLATLRKIVEAYGWGGDLYLLRAFAKLDSNEIKAAIDSISNLLDQIDQNPALVSEATKIAYNPAVSLLSKEFEPIQAKLAYPSDAAIKEGFYYAHPPENVKELLHKATATEDPMPAEDPEGEGLEYVFGFLKSQLWLLQVADASKLMLLYGELNN